jgi:hypothetical protein
LDYRPGKLFGVVTMKNDRERATVQEAGAKGGKARAENMTPEERQEAAQRAAQARWQMEGKHKGVVIAPHNGVIKIGDIEMPCSVLADGTRVLHERGIMKALGVTRAGSKRAKEAKGDGVPMPLFLAQLNLKPFVDLELAEVLQKPIWYRPPSGVNSSRPHKGVRAEMLPRICNVWLKARDAGVLGRAQAIVAINADIITRGLAEVGIVALIDEVTGYHDERPALALTKILEQFVREEIRRYVSAFPLAYFRELCRLRNVPFSESMRLPKYFGHLTNDLIYARLAPGVLAELKRKNPVENGRRKDKNYWWLTDGVGHPALLRLLGSVVTLMKLSDTWTELKKHLDKLHPIIHPLPPLLKGLEGFEDQELN